MLAIALSCVSVCILLAEIWTGIAVIGWQGEQPFLDRSKTPGPYWFMMLLHTIAAVGIPALAFAAQW